MYPLEKFQEKPNNHPQNRVKRPYRSRLEIAANILQIARNGSHKTRIMYLGNLSFELLQKYLDMLLRFQLMEVQDTHPLNYITTDKGREFLKSFRELKELSQVAESRERALERCLTLMPKKTQLA